MTAGRTTHSQSIHWCTPLKYVNAVKQVFDGEILFDPCSNSQSIVHAKVEIRLPDDGLKKEWNYKKIYVNPPYGSDRERKTTIKTWLAKCAYTYRHCETEIIALIPVATNTSHWKKYIWRCASAICFLYDTRLKFLIDGKENKGAPMACIMIYWGKDIDKFQEVFSEFGAVVDIRNLQRIPKIS